MSDKKTGIGDGRYRVRVQPLSTEHAIMELIKDNYAKGIFHRILIAEAVNILKKKKYDLKDFFPIPVVEMLSAGMSPEEAYNKYHKTDTFPVAPPEVTEERTRLGRPPNSKNKPKDEGGFIAGKIETPSKEGRSVSTGAVSHTDEREEPKEIDDSGFLLGVDIGKLP